MTDEELQQQELPLLSEVLSAEPSAIVEIEAAIEERSHSRVGIEDASARQETPSFQSRVAWQSENVSVEPVAAAKTLPFTCPQCRMISHQAQASCAHCNFSLEMADQIFSSGGSGVLRVELFNDDVHCLRLSERQAMEERLERLAQNLSPFFLSIYIDSGLDGISLPTMGFWLLNRAQFFQAEPRRHTTDNASGLLLLIDAATGLASLSLGYRAEQVISHERANKILSLSARPWQQGHYVRSLDKFADLIEGELRKHGRRSLQSQSRGNRRMAR